MIRLRAILFSTFIILLLFAGQQVYAQTNTVYVKEMGKGEDATPAVLEALKKCSANIKYNIYGPVKDETYWQKCKAVIAELPTNITVQYHGEIAPGFVAKAIAQQHVFIMPSKSENFGHAIAESLSAGKPVITSNNTPWNNLEVNTAGINTDTDVQSIAKAISFFAELNQFDYYGFVTGSKLYSIHNNKTPEKIKAYRKLFFGEI